MDRERSNPRSGEVADLQYVTEESYRMSWRETKVAIPMQNGMRRQNRQTPSDREAEMVVGAGGIGEEANFGPTAGRANHSCQRPQPLIYCVGNSDGRCLSVNSNLASLTGQCILCRNRYLSVTNLIISLGLRPPRHSLSVVSPSLQ